MRTTSVPGGLFGAHPDPEAGDRLDGRGNSKSGPGRRFGEGENLPVNEQQANEARRFYGARYAVPGGAASHAAAGMSAAGSHSTNAAPHLHGHRRGGRPEPRASARGAGDSFLDRLGEAEEQDEENEQDMLAVEAASDRATVAAAAAALAAEQGLSQEEQEQLEEQLHLRLQQRVMKITESSRERCPGDSVQLDGVPRAVFT